MDKRSAKEAPIGSKENPITLKAPESTGETKKWTQPIISDEMDIKRLLIYIEKLSGWLDISQKLGVQANSLLMGAAALKKQNKPQEKIDLLMDRLRPVLALKEDIDLYISNSCENILDAIEDGTFHYNHAKVNKESIPEK